MNILVTGANGLVGHHLCQKLLANDHHLWALSRQTQPALLLRYLNHPHFHLIQGDVTDSIAIDTILNKLKIDGIIHLAVQRFYAAADQVNLPRIATTNAYQTNYLGTLNLLQAAADSGVTFWIQGSAMMVYDISVYHPQPLPETVMPAPVEPNGYSVWLAEESCRYVSRTCGLRTIILRFPGIYGRGKNNGVVAKFAKLCRDNQETTLRAANNRFADFLYVGDAVSAILLAMQQVGASTVQTAGDEIFHIGSGHAISIYQLAGAICELTGSTLHVEETTAAESRRFYFDIGKAQQVLGYQPGNLNDNLRHYLRSLQDQDSS